MRATAQGKERRGSARWERGSAAQGTVQKTLGCLEIAGVRKALGAVIHCGCRQQGVDKTHCHGSNFQKSPQPMLFLSSCSLCLCSPGLAKGPAGHPACRLRHWQGEGRTEPCLTVLIHPVPQASTWAHGCCRITLPCPAGWPYPHFSLQSLSPAPCFCGCPGSGLEQEPIGLEVCSALKFACNSCWRSGLVCPTTREQPHILAGISTHLGQLGCGPAALPCPHPQGTAFPPVGTAVPGHRLGFRALLQQLHPHVHSHP